MSMIFLLKTALLCSEDACELAVDNFQSLWERCEENEFKN